MNQWKLKSLYILYPSLLFQHLHEGKAWSFLTNIHNHYSWKTSYGLVFLSNYRRPHDDIKKKNCEKFFTKWGSQLLCAFPINHGLLKYKNLNSCLATEPILIALHQARILFADFTTKRHIYQAFSNRSSSVLLQDTAQTQVSPRQWVV